MARRMLGYGVWDRAVLYALLLGCAYAFFFFAFYPTWRKFECLAHRGVETSGRVIAKEPHNHNWIRYEYCVAGVSYTGISSAGHSGLPPLDEIHLGDRIPVVYLAERPSVSGGGDPTELYGSWSGLLFVILPLGLAVFLVIAVRRGHRRSTRVQRMRTSRLSDTFARWGLRTGPATVLHSPLALDECRRRLTCALEAGEASPGTTLIVGAVRGDTFRLETGTSYSFMFRAYFWGRILASEAGSQVEGKMGTYWFAKAGMFLYFVSIPVWFVTAIVNPRGPIWPSVLTAIAMLCLGYSLVGLNRWLSRADERVVVAFLRRTLDATGKFNE